MAKAEWVPLRTAWQASLYGPGGFYRRHQPAEHFRTSAHASGLFAAALVELARRQNLNAIWDVGAGEGELLHRIHALAPDLELVGVDLRQRPTALPEAVSWQRDLPSEMDGLIFANELLDNIPCDVVELDERRRCRLVEVNSKTGEQRLGDRAAAEQVAWIEAWWPLADLGARAEVGLARETFWAEVSGCGRSGLCVAVDYGHLAGERPRCGSLSSYRKGNQTPVSFDGDHDLTAGVAFDALAAVVGGELRTQREVLHDLGIRGTRPPLSDATTDPAMYLRDLSRATEAAELTAIGGLGDFYWLTTALP